MKAWVLHGVNDIRLEEKEEPQLRADEALVCVKAAHAGSALRVRDSSMSCAEITVIWGHAETADSQNIRQSRSGI